MTMSKIISVLEKMACDSTIISESSIADLVVSSNINDGQQQAIITKNVEALVESTTNLPEVKCFLVIPAEDDDQEQQEEPDDTKTTDTSASVVNF
jgi:hypothetical protein